MIAGLGNKLAELREARKLSQQNVADALGVSQSTIGEYETSARTPSAKMMLRLSSFFSVSIDYLYGTDNSLKVDIGDLPPELQELILNQIATYKEMQKDK